MFFIYFFDLLALMAVYYDVRSVAIFVIQSKSGKN